MQCSNCIFFLDWLHTYLASRTINDLMISRDEIYGRLFIFFRRKVKMQYLSINKKTCNSSYIFFLIHFTFKMDVSNLFITEYTSAFFTVPIFMLFLDIEEPRYNCPIIFYIDGSGKWEQSSEALTLPRGSRARNRPRALTQSQPLGRARASAFTPLHSATRSLSAQPKRARQADPTSALSLNTC